MDPAEWPGDESFGEVVLYWLEGRADCCFFREVAELSEANLWDWRLQSCGYTSPSKRNHIPQ